MNTRYDIDSDLVANTIVNTIVSNEENRIAFKRRADDLQTDGSYIDAMIDNWNKLEDTRHITVRVIKMGPSCFKLVYGDADDCTVKEGTGPFATLAEAKKWFLSGGR